MQEVRAEEVQAREIGGRSWGSALTAKYLAVSVKEEIVLFALGGLEEIKRIRTPEKETEIRRIEFDKSNESVAGICCFGGAVLVYDVDREAVVQRLEEPGCEVKSVGFDGEGRLAFSTREGSVWIWKRSAEGEWEIEEIIEYSDADVKTVVWSGSSLITTGYDGEVVVYSRWEDEMCSVKWEIEEIIKEDSTVWDAAVTSEKVPYLAAVTQSGHFLMYRKNSAWERVFSEKVSTYPVTSVCLCAIEGAEYFAAVVNRNTLVLFNKKGQNAFRKKILDEYDEPVDIVFSKEASAVFITSTSYRKMVRKTKITKITLSCTGSSHVEDRAGSEGGVDGSESGH